VDWFRSDVGMPNAEAGCSPPVVFVVGMIIGLFTSFGFFVALQLFRSMLGFFCHWTCMLQSLEVLWADFVW